MTFNKFATLGNIKESNDFKDVVAEEDMNTSWTKRIEKGKTKNAKDHAKKPVTFLTKAKDAYGAACGKNVEHEASTWRRISIAVHSGACDNVISTDDVPEQTLAESVGSRKGENFNSVTGEPTPNLGHKMPMIMREGTPRCMLTRAGHVSKPLASVKNLVGHTVFFLRARSLPTSRLARSNWMRENDGN